jgi:hypothetical protein
MHKIQLGEGWYANISGDFSGDVEINQDGNRADAAYIIPFRVLLELVAEHKRRKLISVLENMSADEVLNLK